MMRFAALGLIVFAGAVSGTSVQGAPAANDTRPDIIVIVSDDQGWRDIGYHESEIETPVLDRLAKTGVRLEAHYVEPTCSPTRAGLLTGRNASRFGIHSPIAGRSSQAIPGGTATLPLILRQNGYSTALCGKWHLGLAPGVGPRKYGFEKSYGYLHGQIDPYTHLYKNGDRTWHRNDEFVDETGHATDLITDEAVRILEKRDSRPLFLWVAYSVPHHPLSEPDEWTKRYAGKIENPWRRQFAGSVTHMDASIGRIVETVAKAGRTERTLILFTSDNGGQQNYSSSKEYEGRYPPHTRLGDNRPLRGWKGGLYEGGIRVPALVSWPGTLSPRDVKDPVRITDWLPTLVRVAGISPSPDWGIEGRDVWPLLTGKDADAVPAANFYWNTGSQKAVRSGPWKLIVRGAKGAQVELFDVVRDPLEEREQAASQPDVVKRLRAELERQLARDEARP